jgi:hypothetical protein
MVTTTGTTTTTTLQQEQVGDAAALAAPEHNHHNETSCGPALPRNHSSSISDDDDEEEEGVVVVEATAVQEIVNATQVIVVEEEEEPQQQQSRGDSRTSSLPPLSSPSLPASLHLEHVDIDNDDDYEQQQQQHDDTQIETFKSPQSYNTGSLLLSSSSSSSSNNNRSPLCIFLCTSIVLPILYFCLVAVLVRRQLPPPSGPWIRAPSDAGCDEHYHNAMDHFDLILRHALIEFGCACGVVVLNLYQVLQAVLLVDKNIALLLPGKKQDEEAEEDTYTDNHHHHHHSYYSTLMKSLVLEVPMFMMAVLVAVCGYLKNVTAMETEDDFAYPTATLKEYCDLDFVVDGYKTFYVLAWVRIVLSFVLWADHGSQLYTAVSAQAMEQHSRTSSDIRGSGTELMTRQKNHPIAAISPCRIYSSAVLSVAIF